jgi:multiple sugar transport system ATP-binding protein
MTVAQNIGFTLRVSRRPRKEIKERVRETARLLALEELLDRRPKQLSGGQRQRVAMGRAIIRQPQAFLMDEPLSNLDAHLRVQMRGEIEDLQKRLGVTTVYVTHDQVEAMTMGDRIAILRSGELQQVDHPSVVYDQPANLFVASFIGSPPMNLALANVEQQDGGVAVTLGETAIRIPSDLAGPRGLEKWVGKQLIVGIRPEDIREAPGDGASQNGAFPARIERIEALGSDLLGYFPVHAEAPKGGGVAAAAADEALDDAPLVGTETMFCASFEPRTPLRRGNTFQLAPDVEHMHFFDPETEAAL